MSFTGRAVKGAFMRLSSLATTGAKGLIRMAPKPKMDMSSLSIGKILSNPRRNTFGANWGLPSLNSMRHMMHIGGYGSNVQKSMRYLRGPGFVSFAKTKGMQANHLATDGLAQALFKGRHTNLI